MTRDLLQSIDGKAFEAEARGWAAESISDDLGCLMAIKNSQWNGERLLTDNNHSNLWRIYSARWFEKIKKQILGNSTRRSLPSILFVVVDAFQKRICVTIIVEWPRPPVKFYLFIMQHVAAIRQTTAQCTTVPTQKSKLYNSNEENTNKLGFVTLRLLFFCLFARSSSSSLFGVGEKRARKLPLNYVELQFNFTLLNFLRHPVPFACLCLGSWRARSPYLI